MIHLVSEAKILFLKPPINAFTKTAPKASDDAQEKIRDGRQNLVDHRRFT